MESNTQKKGNKYFKMSKKKFFESIKTVFYSTVSKQNFKCTFLTTFSQNGHGVDAKLHEIQDKYIANILISVAHTKTI